MRLYLFLFFVFLIGGSVIGFAEEKGGDHVQTSMEQASLITKYDEILWQEDLLKGRENNLGAYSSLNARYIKNAYPWMFSLIYPDSSVGIKDWAKWRRDFSISLDYPNKLQPVPTVIGTHNVRAFHGYKTDVNPVIIKRVRDTIVSALPDIISSTGLNLSFVESETTDNPSLVRIVLLHDAPWENAYRAGNVSRRTGGTGLVIEKVEANYSAKVSFTPGLLSQVSGYFVLDADGGIQFAVCKISDELPVPMIEPIVKECLLRVMGLPSLQDIEEESFLTAWNGSMSSRYALSAYMQEKSGIPPYDQAILRALYARPN